MTTCTMYEASIDAGDRAPRNQGARPRGSFRIIYDAVGGGYNDVEIYGYSKTFGRCEECNKMAADIIKRDDAFEGVQVRWSNEGY